MRSRYSNVAATMAVLVALSGGAYALTIGKSAIRSKHIKKSAITTPKVKKNAITSQKVRNGTLRAVDFKAGVLTGGQGSQGLQGPQGEPGVPGTPGAPGLADLEYVRTQFTNLASGQTGTYQSVCPSGKAPVTGGFDSDQAMAMRSTKAVNSTGSTSAEIDAWSVSLHNIAMNGASASGYVYALCATVGGGFPNPGWSS